jgi:hypothetical protein
MARLACTEVGAHSDMSARLQSDGGVLLGGTLILRFHYHYERIYKE